MVSLPTPARSVKFPPGEGWAARSAFARGPCGKVDSPYRRPRPRAHILMHTHTSAHSHECTVTHTPMCFRDHGRVLLLSACSFPSFLTGGARGAGRGQRRN